MQWVPAAARSASRAVTTAFSCVGNVSKGFRDLVQDTL